METIPKDIEKAISSFEKVKQEEPKKLEPFNIKKEVSKIEKEAQKKGSGYFYEAIEELKKTTPCWVWFEGIINTKVTPYIYIVQNGFDHEKMGDMIIKRFHLVKYPKLQVGAVYGKKKGAWRYFAGKDEMRFFVEREVLRELQNWGYYDQKYIPWSRIYILQKVYDPSYPSETPFDRSKPELVVFKNGTYNILTDKMKPHEAKDYILLSYDYDLDTSGRDTPYTDSLLDGLVGENALFLKQFIGYTFYRSHAPAQEMVFLKGSGGEGKSSFLNFLSENIFCEDNVSSVTPQDLSDDRFQVVELLGKAVNVSADIKDDYIEDSSIIKRLTGNDSLFAQYKGVQGFTMRNHAKLIFSANTLPRFKDLTEGFSHRLVVIPFLNGNQRLDSATFWKEHDMNKVKEEAAAFAYSCIQEFRKIFDGKRALFTKPESLLEATKDWINENDHIGEFLSSSVKIHSGDDRGEIGTTVFKEYQEFCKQSGYVAKSKQEFRKYLEGQGLVKKKSRKCFNDGGSNLDRYIGLELTISYINPSLY
ncbi:MAG: phage/plasmid primase, P4 family [Staphylococcus equorum]|nr:phage/plasmid primase, P4 family [Staphylococcus equorum]